ncbi:prolyl oligopeptidase family serine peptidase [Flavobacterium sp. ov086]|uniref:prolyl oligopeptidase family serine peptidase n=1 Tax=Flavobacterium sp. ov086 TaxID=1761785 RepID=UPI000B65FF7E|nr:prolyl oligopeptidase family serine peptidase [Flavobacterium sp. ov086]SNR95334.1 prolyl oligopeptidase [Flavobacterium sp. ov086]
MKKKIILVLILISSFSNDVFCQDVLPERPTTKDYFGKSINDPYSYLENANDTLSKSWFKQNSLKTREILNSITGRKDIIDKLVEIEKRKSFSVTHLKITANDCFFYLKKTDQDKRAKLFYKPSEKAQEVMLFDPREYKKDSGNDYSITYLKPSWDGKKVALSFSKNGEEISEIAFLDVESKTLLPEILLNCWPAELGGVNWLPDDSGIVYLHIPVIDKKSADYILNTESVIYKLGDNPSVRKVIFSKENNPDLNIGPVDFPEICEYSINDKYILGKLDGAAAYFDYYYAKIEELHSEKINWKPLFNKKDGFSSPVIVNEDIYSLASKSSPNYKIIKTKITNPDFVNPEIIVNEDKNEIIDSYEVIKDGLVYSTTKNGVQAQLYFVDNSKVHKTLVLPKKAGRIIIRSKNKYYSDLWIYTSGWLNPLKRYRYDIAKNSFREDNISPVVTYPEFDDFIVEEIEIPGNDGTLVPVSLIYKKGIKKNKMNYVLIDGYGAYGESMSPSFQPIYLSWVLNGGVYVVSHVRGGGEKGDDWYTGGYKSTKPNTWKDLISTAEFLIKDKITSSKKIAIYGSSAGGIMVGRAITERPDLFKVMICENGFVNTLRIDVAPNGPNNMKEFGNPLINEEFNTLYEMDAYHHIEKAINYPACLITTGINDARVAPWMSAKFVAKLRASTISSNPILFAVDYNTGHGMDSSNLQLYNDYADAFAFAFWQMGHPKFKLKK